MPARRNGRRGKSVRLYRDKREKREGYMETIAGGEESRYYALSTLPEGVEDMTLTAYAVVLRDGTEIPVDYTLTVCFRRPYV